jgi:hypothetical protein
MPAGKGKEDATELITSAETVWEQVHVSSQACASLRMGLRRWWGKTMARVEIGARRRDKTMGWRQCLVRLRRGLDDLHEFWLLRRRRSLLDDGTRGQNNPPCSFEIVSSAAVESPRRRYTICARYRRICDGAVRTAISTAPLDMEGVRFSAFCIIELFWVK